MTILSSDYDFYDDQNTFAPAFFDLQNKQTNKFFCKRI